MTNERVRYLLLALLTVLLSLPTANWGQEASSRIPDLYPATPEPDMVPPEVRKSRLSVAPSVLRRMGLDSVDQIPPGPETSPIWISLSYLQEEQIDLATAEVLTPFDRLHFGGERDMRTDMRAKALREGRVQEALAMDSCSKTAYRRGSRSGKSVSLDSLLANSVAIVRGRVLAREEGFLTGIATSLVELKVEEMLYRSPGKPVLDWLLLDYPFADFSLPGGYLFCSLGEHTLPAPEAGDELIHFVTHEPGQDSHMLGNIEADRQTIFASALTGQLSLPRFLTTDPDLGHLETMDQVVALLRERLESR